MRPSGGKRGSHPSHQEKQVAQTLDEQTYIANYNAPDQTIVGGTRTALEKLAAELNARGLQAQLLPVPCPYHTPLLAGAGALLQRSLDAR